MMEGPRHKHLHQEWQEPLEELGALASSCSISIIRDALRGTPGGAYTQPEPNATVLPSCATISTRTAQKAAVVALAWRGGRAPPAGPRRPSPVPSPVARPPQRPPPRPAPRLHVSVLYVSPKGSDGGGIRVLGVGSTAGKWRVPR